MSCGSAAAVRCVTLATNDGGLSHYIQVPYSVIGGLVTCLVYNMGGMPLIGNTANLTVGQVAQNSQNETMVLCI